MIYSPSPLQTPWGHFSFIVLSIFVKIPVFPGCHSNFLKSHFVFPKSHLAFQRVLVFKFSSYNVYKACKQYKKKKIGKISRKLKSKQKTFKIEQPASCYDLLWEPIWPQLWFNSIYHDKNVLKGHSSIKVLPTTYV